MTQDLEQQIVETLSARLVGLLSDSVLMIAGLLLIAATISVLWTEFKKAELADGDGLDITKREVKWRIRKAAFWAGTIPAFVLLAVFLPELTPDDWPTWAELLVRAAIAASLAPIGGLVSPFWWLLLVKWIGPLAKLAWQSAANALAERVFGRKGQVRPTDDGGVAFKPEDQSKTQILGKGDGAKPPPDEPTPPTGG